MYSAEILADSVSPYGDRITTFKLTFPRFILAEFNTHRMFSRNSASSRAIPLKKMIKMVQENPFVPIAFQKEHTGMQGFSYLEGKDDELCREFWLKARDEAVVSAKSLDFIGATKQLCNRLLEPFMWHTVIVTATDWTNFFNLRCPIYKTEKGIDIISPTSIGESFEDLLDRDVSMAEIHIQKIAHMMFDAYCSNMPEFLYQGQWHIPFNGKLNEEQLKQLKDVEDIKLKIAAARCARVSYETLGDNPKVNHFKDVELCETLINSKHASPLEHVARVRKGRYGNLNGYESYRYLLEQEGSL